MLTLINNLDKYKYASKTITGILFNLDRYKFEQL